jgi:hypothetical protein
LFYKEKKSCINQSGIGYKQKYRPKKIFERKKKIKEFIIDETLKIGSELIWLWVATIELESNEILGISISEREICA